MLVKNIERIDELLLTHKITTYQDIEFFQEDLDKEYLEKRENKPNECLEEHCKLKPKVRRSGQVFKVRCDEGHINEIKIEKTYKYRLDFKKILEDIINHLDMNLKHFESNLPEYIMGETQEGYFIYLVVSPSDFKKTIDQISIEAVQLDYPSLLLVSENKTSTVLERLSFYSTGNLIYSLPFRYIKNKEKVKERLNKMNEIKKVERNFLKEQENKDEDPLVTKLNSNPRYIMTELNHIKILRESDELKGGERLEKIAESAFSHLFPTITERGGEDDLFENLPDNLFYIPELKADSYGEYPSVLGVVDTKSGKKANFDKEKVEGKHKSYIQKARAQSINRDYIAHIFVVLDIKGHQEIKFFDKMDYNTEEEYMIIFTVDALIAILGAYLSYKISNELKLHTGDFRKAIYPLFNKDRFIKENKINNITRDVGDQEKYDKKYDKRPNLIYVDKEVVVTLFKQISTEKGKIESMLMTYFD